MLLTHVKKSWPVFIICDRFNRSTVVNGSVYSGPDRHNAEIVAFYLSLLLDMRRTPVAVGRIVNLSTDILANADPDLAATFFKNSKFDFSTFLTCIPKYLNFSLRLQIKARIVFTAFVVIASRN